MHDGHDHLATAPLRALTAAIRLLIGLFLALFTLASVLALSVTAPATVAEGQPVTVSVAGTGTLGILLDGQPVASGVGSVQHTLPTNETSAGLRQYTFTSTAEANVTRTVEITDIPLTVTVVAPTASESTANDITFTVETNWPAELCYVTIDGGSHTLAALTGTRFSDTIAVADGVHSLAYKCKLGSELPSVTRSILVDSHPPAITGASPGGEQTGPYITLTVDTDEIAQCRYGTSDAQYGELPASMGATYALRNTATLTLQDAGAYTYFVRCADVYGNTMPTSQVISFVNKIAPIATIAIGEKQPLTAGTYGITLKTNVPLGESPKLSYTLQESGKGTQVGLTGDGDRWEGFITIPEGISDSVLTFSFEGKNRQGMVGTQIEDGGVITIDALPPGQIDAITVKGTTGGITLGWFVKEPEEGIVYRVYRADHEDVSYADYLAATKGMEWTDTAAGGAQYYYYRVAQVDEAGNIGPLSQEVWSTVIDPIVENITADPLADATIQQAMLDITATLLDANTTIKNLETEPNPSKRKIIEFMGLLDKARESRNALEDELRMLEGMRVTTQEQATGAFTHAQSAIMDARNALVVRIAPENEIQTNQPIDLEGLERNLAFGTFGETVSDDDAYLASAKALQERLTVRVDAVSFTMWTLAGEEQHRTYVRKTIALDTPASDIKVIEIIPKDVASDVSEIAFSDEPTVIERDPVVQYTFPVLQQNTYSYVLDRIVPLDAVQRARTFAYPRPAQEAAAAITGNAVSDLPVPSLETALIIIALLIIIGLVTYYVALTREERPFRAPAALAQRRPAQRPAPRRVERIVVRPIAAPAKKDAYQLLADAGRKIDQKDYEGALAAYKDVISSMENDAGLHAALATDAEEVYRKLLLYKNLDDAAQALRRKDVPVAKRTLEEAKRLAVDVGDQGTMLTDDAKETFARFVRELNMLEIERTAQY